MSALAGKDKSDKGQITVSVIIPTRNRSDLLRDVLESLFNQTFDPKRFEIVVVDNASTDDTPQMMEQLQQAAPCSLLYHRLEKDCGPAHGRNQAVRLSQGAILAFTDSDCRADREWMEKGVRALTEGVAFVTGSVLHKPNQRVRLFSGMFDPVEYEHPSYPTCNAFYRREVFLEFEGFDEALCYHTFFDNKPIECADTDLAWRIKESGRWNNVFVKDQVIYHEVPVKDMWKWMLDPYRIFVVAVLVKKHPRLRKLLLRGGVFFQSENMLFYLALLGLVLALKVHPAFLVFAIPYPLRAGYLLRNNLTLLRFPKLLLQIPLLAARQAVLCAGLIYGSVRFRSLVL